MQVEEIEHRDPVAAFAPLAEEPYALLLHGGALARDARWSILVAFPAQTLEYRGGATYLDDAAVAADPFGALSRLQRSRSRTRGGRNAPFATGLAGFIGYEMGAAIEPSAAGPPSPYALPDMAIGAYDASIVFDRKERRAFVASRDARARARLLEALGRATPAARRPAFSAATRETTPTAYRAAVANVVGRIRDGALFQANIAQRLAAIANEGAAYDVFRAVATQDAPYSAFLNFRDGAVISASPERFFSLRRADEGFRIVAEPIKGTRRRGSGAEDAAIADFLLADPKERAENVMIADLARNDLSRVCTDESIREEAICALLSTQTVHHLVSRISGVLRDGVCASDALAALFPCGSVTGAPKVEAMRVIAEIEGKGRGPYCGAVGYIDDAGDCDFAVAIRTMIVERAGGGLKACLPVGGGVTLRSDPGAEDDETLAKAAAMLAALGAGAPAP